MNSTLATKIVAATDAKFYPPAAGVQITPTQLIELVDEVEALDDSANGLTFDLDKWIASKGYSYPEEGQALGRRNDVGFVMDVRAFTPGGSP